MTWGHSAKSVDVEKRPQAHDAWGLHPTKRAMHATQQWCLAPGAWLHTTQSYYPAPATVRSMGPGLGGTRYGHV